MIKQFEKDNKFCLNKKVWNKIVDEGICLKYKERNISKENYNDIKHLVRRGMNASYSDMLKIRKFVEYSLVDSIEKGRSNDKYIKLMIK
jgi:hypothetical protein